MKSSGFISKFLVGAALVSAFSSGIVNGAERMNEQYFGQIFQPQNPNRAYGAPDRFFSSPYSHRPNPNPNNQPRKNN